MTRWQQIGVLALLALAVSVEAHAGPHSAVRYALVVGNNSGQGAVVELPALQHAEDEARQLGRQLVERGNFDPEHVVVLTGASRAQVLAAAQTLAQRHAREKSELGALPTLFTFFFTGHGVDGKLLVADAPLTSEDIGGIFRGMNATLSVGFFDACFAGGLDLNALHEKGARVTPGFNPVSALPDEVLNSEGTLWFVSSRRDELSYEDERLGGLFTHFFIEAFTRAPSDEVGITLESMWEYARRHTLDRVSQFGRQQTPEMIVRNLKARGPLYLSFSRPRTGLLRFGAETEGTFLVHYNDSELIETFVKERGRPYEVAVYSGELTLTRLSDGARAAGQRLQVADGSEIEVAPSSDGSARAEVGYGRTPIRSKGELSGLELAESGPRSTVLLGLGGGLLPLSSSLMAAPFRGNATVLLARGDLSLGIELGYGRRGETFESWGYALGEWSGRLAAGYGFGLGGTRLQLEGGAGLIHDRLAYDSHQVRTADSPWLFAGARFLVPLPLRQPWVVLQVRAGAALRQVQGLAAADQSVRWTGGPEAELGLLVPVAGL